MKAYLWLVLLSRVLAKSSNLDIPENQQKPCSKRYYDDEKIVCVCNDTYCDTLPEPQKLGKGRFYLYETNKAGLRFQKSLHQFEKRKSKNSQGQKVHIDRSKKYQKILGFGGAFTDATGINIKKLNPKGQDALMEAYFGDNGIEYSNCRVPIGCSDFSTHAYTYNDIPVNQEDLKMEKFKLAEEDFAYKIPFMKIAKQKRGNKQFRLFGSPWGAPKWLKTNHKYSGDGAIIKKYYAQWALYFKKFLEAYAQNDLCMWAVTTQNEQSLAVLEVKAIPSTKWLSIDLANFIGKHLGPTIKKMENSCPEVLIMAMDDQKPLLPFYMFAVFNNEAARNYTDGTAFHWYLAEATPRSALLELVKKFPDKFLMSTEACTGFQNSTGINLGSYEGGENYAKDIIENLNSFVSGWIDWNLVLDLQGGPNFIKNYVDAPIIVNETSKEFYKQPTFYVIGHFSKFLPIDSVCIESKKDLGDDLMTVAFERPDKGIVVVILNTGESDEEIEIVDGSIGVATVKATRRSINTILYHPE